MEKRFYSIDLIRVLAMFFVVFAHTKLLFFSPTVHPYILSALNVFATIGVPLFVMLTGYLMFDRNYEDKDYLKKFLSKNLLPLFVSYEIWNIIWNLLRYTCAEEPEKWVEVFKSALFMGYTLTALWYLPMAIAIYLGLPIISVACHKISSQLYKKLLWIVLILSGTVIPSIVPVCSLIGYNPSVHPILQMNIFGASSWGDSVWMIYLLSGWYISKGKLKNLKTSVIVAFGIVIPFLIMYAMEVTGHAVYNYNFIPGVCFAVSFFELLTRTEKMLPKYAHIQNLITGISKFSFAVYIMHIYVGGAITRVIKETVGLVIPLGQTFSSITSVLFYICFLITIVFVIWIIVSILKRNNFIKRYVLLMK